MPALARAQWEAPAKVNLTLEVVGVMADGYHELDTVFCWLDMADTLESSPGPELALEVEGQASGLPLAQGEDNLIMRAGRLLEHEVGRTLPVTLRLIKRLPIGGGLGGGSSDAGTVLYALNRQLELGLSPARLEELGSRLGADVAFHVHGGTARGRGRGHVLKPLPPAPPMPVLLVMPPFGCPTGEVYRLWDRKRYRPAQGASERMAAVLQPSSRQALLEALGNDLQPAAEELRPELKDLRKAMLRAGCDVSMVAGSGSSLFGLVTEPHRAEPVRDTLVRALGDRAQVILTRLRGVGRRA